MSSRLDPLTWNEPIVDPKTGRPTPEFIRKWEQQNTINQAGADLSNIHVLAGSGLTGGGALSSDVTLSANVQAVLNQLSASRGSLIYRGNNQWSILAPGTSTNVLTTHGAGADPTWAAIPTPALTDTHIFVGNGSNLAADVAVSGDATLADTGALTVTGVHAANGSEPNPSITFGGDPDTGFYSVSSNHLGLTIGGTNQITWSDGLTLSSVTGGGNQLQMVSEGVTNNLVRGVTASNSNPPRYTMQRAEGTIASMTAVASGGELGRILFSGYGGTGFQIGVTLKAATIETTPSDTAMGSRYSILMAAIGATAQTEVARFAVAQQNFLGPVKIGSASSAPDASSILDIGSTTQGFLPPRMTTTQRNAISSPADGLRVYDTTLHASFQYQNGSWVQFTTGTLPTGANPSATASDTAVNGSAATFMRSDAAPAVQKASASVFGVAKVDGTTITASAGVITATGFVPSGAAYHPGYVTGRFYSTVFASLSVLNIAANTLYATPIYVPTTTTITKMMAAVTTLAAGKSIELGIYNNSGGVPTTLLSDAGTISAGATGDIVKSGLSIVLAPGWYWVVMASDGTPGVRGLTANDVNIMGVATTNTNVRGINGSWTFSAGNLPASFPAITYGASTFPVVWVAP